jgi:hypothetical protein
MQRTAYATSLLLFLFLLAPGLSIAPQEQRFPDIVHVNVRPAGQETFHFYVTVSSPYDSPRRYADAFRVMGKDGTVFGERNLLHHHAEEQPFTRDLHGVVIPKGVKTVIVQGRDKQNGYGGKTQKTRLPGR